MSASEAHIRVALPSMSAEEWNDARTVHEIAVGQNSRILCHFCWVPLWRHPGPARVIPDVEQPEEPMVFGSEQCEATWRDWQERTARLPESYDVTGWTVHVMVVDGLPYLAGDVVDDRRVT